MYYSRSLPKSIGMIMMWLSSSLLFWHPVQSFSRATLIHRAIERSSSFTRDGSNRVTLLNRKLYSTTTTRLHAVSLEDEAFLNQAMEVARNGFGRTFPNPAVGCVLVRQDTQEVIGSGFHPKAGFPHAEVFALLEAAGHVDSGIEAAKSVTEGNLDEIQQLTDQYIQEGGPAKLIGGSLKDFPVTAYVTLEPCCHTSKRTPPCANSLVLASVNRVVVGFRDPNPRVDGGGVEVLQKADITVDLAEGMANLACSDLVDSFVKRISPKEYDTDYAWVNGAMRRSLRKLAGQLKADDALTQHIWISKQKASDQESVDVLELDGPWMERLDFLLWQKELVILRLNSAVGKNKLARRLGERIAEALGAHVAQTVGHTALLYRPGDPPMLDFQDLLAGDGDKDLDEN